MDIKIDISNTVDYNGKLYCYQEGQDKFLSNKGLWVTREEAFSDTHHGYIRKEFYFTKVEDITKLLSKEDVVKFLLKQLV